MHEPNLAPLYVAVIIAIPAYFWYLQCLTKNILWSCFGTVGYVCLLATAFFLPQKDFVTVLFVVGATLIVSSILLILGLYFFENSEERGETP